jgi:hypothetical protein
MEIFRKPYFSKDRFISEVLSDLGSREDSCMPHTTLPGKDKALQPVVMIIGSMPPLLIFVIFDEPTYFYAFGYLVI